MPARCPIAPRVLATVCSAMVLMAGCANLDPPAKDALYQQAMAGTQVPAQWVASAQTAAFAPQWAGFPEHGTLQSLIDEALDNNLDLRVAASRMQQAAHQARLAGADLLPTVGLGARTATDPTPGSAFSANGYAVLMNWEIDLWGRARAEKMAGEAGYRSAEADYAYARQSIGALTARSWLAALEASGQLALAQELENTTGKQLSLIQYRRRIGKVSEMDVAHWTEQVAAAADVVAQREQARAQALRALELILGRYPAGAAQADEPIPDAPAPVAAGLPLDLLDRRPDLVAARERLVSAYFGAEEAKAARLPAIAIFAGAGRFTKDYSGLATSMQSWVFPVGAALTWPLFDAGRRQITLELRTEQQREALALYARAILIAMSEVENGLTGEQQLALRERAIQRQFSESSRALELALVQRQIGQFDDFDVLQRKRDLLRVQSDLMRVRAQRLVQRVNLHLALGGHFAPEPQAAPAVAGQPPAGGAPAP
ncbi:NodT family efflux transporter outer membrane factor (OMF) lipoprotein [Achromobacter deleyi]|uniref:TolC family protein n=1 Tax=Achromobacter deleyi TaxID=1353891 RepID=UPI00285C8988|nr:TolC family protein [Achromobacter deleyi]MDR6599818.1 NodT family efflux transporter outer membrane factor (OMF) lipoprotein [Achromobacter deleyi]